MAAQFLRKPDGCSALCLHLLSDALPYMSHLFPELRPAGQSIAWQKAWTANHPHSQSKVLGKPINKNMVTALHA